MNILSFHSPKCKYLNLATPPLSAHSLSEVTVAVFKSKNLPGSAAKTLPSIHL